jgi:dihydroorotate dehydrogenase (NAD+) catalytic subunit
MVWELWDALHIPEKPIKAVPLVGMGGIAGAEDALEFLMAGAAAVQVGSATFARPPVMNEIIRGIRTYMEAHGMRDIAELCIRSTSNGFMSNAGV